MGKIKPEYEKVPLVGLLDRRRKLTDEHREDIQRRYKNGEGVRSIARQYEGVCSRRSIQFELFPERLKTMQERDAKNQHWKKYYNRENLTKAVAKWRKYKKELYQIKTKPCQ